MNKRRLITSLLTIVVAAVVVIGATRAFFSDTETSTGNTFVAGAIDLLVDNESYVTDENGDLVASPNTSWGLDNLTGHLFFNFRDLKPGDIGEDTISLHVNDNDAWLCAAARVTEDSDVDYNEPELEDDQTVDLQSPLTTQGELGGQLNFAFWADDGDNVFESDEIENIFVSGPVSGLNQAGQIALADSQTNVWTTSPEPVNGGETVYIGKAWCFGTLSRTPVQQDNSSENGPLSPVGEGTRGTGFACDGASVNNAAQTDRVMGDIQFYAVQSRNNPNFTCGQNYTPVWPEVVQRPTVGANLVSLGFPQCDVTVNDDGGNVDLDTIQEGINAAQPEQTVCVEAGTYNEDVNVNKSITLTGAGALTTLINGQTAGEPGALVVSADNVTVQGFGITEIAGGVAALRISGARSGITLASNKATGGQNAFLADGGQNNHSLFNNEFVGTTANPIAYVNGLASVNVASTNVSFMSNTFSGTGTMALGQEAGGSSITLNKFSATTSFTDVEDWEGGNIYGQNNFNDAGLNLQHSGNVNTGDNGITNAENNWWGDNNPADGDASADVDFTPFEVSAFPEN